MKARTRWDAVCTVDDLVPESGIAVWTEDGPVAVFYLPHRLPALFAISHGDPFSGANVLARTSLGETAIVSGNVPDPHLRHEPVAILHFSHGPFQCHNCLGRVRYDRRE